MRADRKKTINFHYLSRLIGPLALANEMDTEDFLSNHINYSDHLHCRLIINHLIRPNFDRVDENTKQEIKNALGLLYANPSFHSSLVEEKLLLCNIPPEDHFNFIQQLCEEFFTPGAAIDFNLKDFKIQDKPLNASQYSFVTPTHKTLDESLEELRAELINL